MRISDWSSDVCSSDLLVIGLRWYLARAKDGYLRENASYSQISETLTESTEGARTIEALGIGHERVAALDADCAGSYAAERYTLRLRTVFFPSLELSYLLPTVATQIGRASCRERGCQYV